MHSGFTFRDLSKYRDAAREPPRKLPSGFKQVQPARRGRLRDYLYVAPGRSVDARHPHPPREQGASPAAAAAARVRGWTARRRALRGGGGLAGWGRVRRRAVRRQACAGAGTGRVAFFSCRFGINR